MVCVPRFFFLQKQVLWSSLNVAPRPCQERGGAPWAWLTGNIAWLVLSFPHRANSSGPEPLSIFRHPSLSPGCRQPVLREPSTAQGSRLPSVLPELLPGRVSSTFAQVSACGWGGEPCSQIRAFQETDASTVWPRMEPAWTCFIQGRAHCPHPPSSLNMERQESKDAGSHRAQLCLRLAGSARY